MTSMIEQAAKAIYEKRNGAGCRPWSRIGKAHQEPYLSDARAALPVFKAEAVAAVPNTWLDPLMNIKGPLGCPEIEKLLNGVRSRIDAALKEPQS